MFMETRLLLLVRTIINVIRLCVSCSVKQNKEKRM